MTSPSLSLLIIVGVWVIRKGEWMLFMVSTMKRGVGGMMVLGMPCLRHYWGLI